MALLVKQVESIYIHNESYAIFITRQPAIPNLVKHLAGFKRG